VVYMVFYACIITMISTVVLRWFVREKEDDLERRFKLLNRELRSCLSIQGLHRHSVLFSFTAASWPLPGGITLVQAISPTATLDIFS